MTNFDWTEGQEIPGMMINPGTGPVHNASREHAEANMAKLLEDAGAANAKVKFIKEWGDDRYMTGRYAFEVTDNGRTAEVDMPGLALDEVRFIGLPEQNIFDYPRLYIDGDSWIWSIGINVLHRHLYDSTEEE